MFGLCGSSFTSTTPVSLLMNRTRSHDFPPSLVLYRPRSSFGPHRWPSAATYTMFGLRGSISISPMWWVSAKPMDVHESPPSVDLNTPAPHEEVFRLFASPVPTHTTDGSDCATAIAP